MNISTAISKLQQYGFNVQKLDGITYSATKGDKVINITITTTNELDRMAVWSRSLRHTKVCNVTNALKTLGEMEAVSRKTSHPGAARSNTTIVEEFYKHWKLNRNASQLFPEEKLQKLNIKTKKCVTDEFMKIYSGYFERDKYGSFAKNDKPTRNVRDNINEAINSMWEYTRKIFLKNYPHIKPLRKLKIETSVPDFDDVKASYYNTHAKNSVECYTSVFAHTERDAVNICKAIVGNFANVVDCGIFGVGDDQEELLMLFEEQELSNGPVKDLENVETAKKILLDAENTLKIRTRELDLCEKKVEFAMFLSNLATHASAASSDEASKSE